MAFEFHTNPEVYFEQQYTNAKKYIFPFLNGIINLEGKSVLEIGSGEGGVLKVFSEKGCRITGVDLVEAKIETGKRIFAKEIAESKARFICDDIYNFCSEKFDLIILKDALEHIHGHEKILEKIQSLLNPGGKVFLAFPPWQMPFGGHQQMCRNKFMSLAPFIHLLPNPLYIGLLRMFHENEGMIDHLLEIKETRITIERFESIIKGLNYKIDKKLFYFINPNYEVKFNLKPRKQLDLISKIPFLRDFLVTTCFYVISVK
ncbi:MAG: class I SAM-dependent methyltransferase [Ignavibacteria bacterium]|jgi:SAM-dependent methyltransferase|nr:class I SAM-dependent methyltransferase [Ignavibacteria bacterium]MCU7502890.1 class I SAM-dependent methyltransferase [Ignavibacteria bacterium]MCU7515616.1 class I SAM-dependent methyltransferase [Ignavibacteria bacterium]